VRPQGSRGETRPACRSTARCAARQPDPRRGRRPEDLPRNNQGEDAQEQRWNAEQGGNDRGVWDAADKQSEGREGGVQSAPRLLLFRTAGQRPALLRSKPGRESAGSGLAGLVDPGKERHRAIIPPIENAVQRGQLVGQRRRAEKVVLADDLASLERLQDVGGG